MDEFLKPDLWFLEVFNSKSQDEPRSIVVFKIEKIFSIW
jgi:hypothetical protein